MQALIDGTATLCCGARSSQRDSSTVLMWFVLKGKREFMLTEVRQVRTGLRFSLSTNSRTKSFVDDGTLRNSNLFLGEEKKFEGYFRETFIFDFLSETERWKKASPWVIETGNKSSAEMISTRMIRPFCFWVVIFVILIVILNFCKFLLFLINKF